MKIISIYYTHKPGGFCKRLYRLLGALAAAGHEVHYLSLDQPPQSLSSRVSVSRIPFPFTIRRGALFWLTFTCWGTLWFTLYAWRLRPQRIMVFGAYYGALCLLANKLLKIPSILFIRSLVFKINRITQKPPFLCWCSDLLELTGMKNATQLVAMSSTMAAELARFIGKSRSIEILPNDCHLLAPPTEILDVNLQKLLNEKRQRGKTIALVSGVFDKRKNLLLLIDCFIALSHTNQNHNLELIVAGIGPEIAHAKKLLSCQTDPCVSFIGWIDSPTLLLPLIDLVIHPSKHEGMPNAVLEAWGQGLPTLLADTPELREMVRGEDLLFDTTDKNILLERLLKINDNPADELEKLRQASFRIARHFTFDWDQKAVQLIIDLPNHI